LTSENAEINNMPVEEQIVELKEHYQESHTYAGSLCSDTIGKSRRILQELDLLNTSAAFGLRVRAFQDRNVSNFAVDKYIPHLIQLVVCN